MSNNLFNQPVHTPSDDILLAFAAGRLNPAFGLVISSHLYYSPLSRQRVSELECLGGLLMENLPPADISEKSLKSVLGSLDRSDFRDGSRKPQGRTNTPKTSFNAPNKGSQDGAANSELPDALAQVIGSDLDALPWRKIVHGVEEANIPGGKIGPCRARLMRIAPHTKVVEHTHAGTEMTLVLKGCYKDTGQSFHVGDLHICDASVHHQPYVDEDKACLCLVASDAPIRLKGLVGRLINPFLRSA